MIKAVLFDFDETLQDRTSAFDKYTDAFTAEFMPNLSNEERQKRRDDMVRTGNGGYAERNTWFSGLIKMWGWENSPGAKALTNHYEKNFGKYYKISLMNSLILTARMLSGVRISPTSGQ